ncbi:hypothetical protein L228DRAFT_177250 [Xylona heveae TC161]|uniref:Uncharacterized protein n=1 Tax=Xylona heveae (strain CBS 132557 / TC161) TaxID=1328760 RepID=A0A165F830_XYLHT|nr:hypothetical protein L228DRAFT_177250 [Xylona heveae TC161]KZF20684.1 hypothetical protein L228DRAFT_177250 [Xylona heveae TC161]
MSFPVTAVPTSIRLGVLFCSASGAHSVTPSLQVWPAPRFVLDLFRPKIRRHTCAFHHRPPLVSTPSSSLFTLFLTPMRSFPHGSALLARGWTRARASVVSSLKMPRGCGYAPPCRGTFSDPACSPSLLFNFPVVLLDLEILSFFQSRLLPSGARSSLTPVSYMTLL